MGFWSKLFSKKEKPKKQKVKISEFDEWFSDNASDFLKECNDDVLGIAEEIEESIKECFGELKNFENAELMNENITLKEKQFMEGNRLAYAKKLKDFLARIKPPKDAEKLKSYIGEYQLHVAEFVKGSARALAISANFFESDLKNINKILSQIESSIKQMAELFEGGKYVSLLEAKEKAFELQRLMAEEEKLTALAEKLDSELGSLKKQKVEEEQKVENFRKSEKFGDLKKLNDSLAEHEKEKKILDAGFIDNFMQIDKALKKFAKLDDEKLINEYLENPVTAVVADSDWKIVGIIDRLKDALDKSQIELEDKKKEKIAEKIKQMNRDFFTNFLIQHNGIELKLNELKRAISKNNSNSELSDLQYKAEHVVSRIKHTMEQLGKTNQQIEKLPVVETKEILQDELQNADFDVEVII